MSGMLHQVVRHVNESKIHDKIPVMNYRTFLFLHSACPAVGPYPGTTFKTPSGTPASAANLAAYKAPRGEVSATFATYRVSHLNGICVDAWDFMLGAYIQMDIGCT